MKIEDTFRGDTDSLRRSIKALIELDEAKALVPHGISGHAKGLLSAAYVRLAPLSTPPGRPTREEITKAIGEVDASFGYSFNMTRLVDGVATHTLTMDGYEPVDFEDRDDGYRLIEERRNQRRADAILSLLRPATSGEDVERVARAIHAVRFEEDDTEPFDDEREMARAAIRALGASA